MKSFPVSNNRNLAVTKWVELLESLNDNVRVIEDVMGTTVLASPRRTCV